MSDEATTLEAPAPKTKPAPRPKAKAAPKAGKAASSPNGKETVRVRALKALKSKGDMTAPQIQETIGLGHGLKPTMDQEVERGHLKLTMSADGHTATYHITAAGVKALEKGTVNPPRGSKE